MELNICHLYPDLLNLYGDIGNLLILKYRALIRGIKVNIIPVSLGDSFSYNDYDITFFCGGQDYEQKIVSKDIIKFKRENIVNYIEDNRVLIAICGGYQLLGNYYELVDGTRINGLGILDIYTKASDDRFVGNIVIKNDEYNQTYVGFENHSGRTYINNMQPLGRCIKGYGNNGETGDEGCIYKNTICSYLHGPLLSKNPELADRILKTALEKKYGNINIIDIDDEFENKAKDYIINK